MSQEAPSYCEKCEDAQRRSRVLILLGALMVGFLIGLSCGVTLMKWVYEGSRFIW